MDHFDRLKRQANNYVTIVVLAFGLCLAFSAWVCQYLFELTPLIILAVLISEIMVAAFVAPAMITNYLLEPVRILWQAILHVSPDNHNVAAPNLEKSRLGRELITNLCLQVYQFASAGDNPSSNNQTIDLRAGSIANSLPLPLLVMDKDQNVTFVNDASLKYLGLQSNELIGKNLYNALDFMFQTTDTFDKWLDDSRAHTITNSRSWDHVKVKLSNRETPLQVDMAAYYNKENPTGIETIITLFDHTDRYGQEEKAISYVALAVHELRTPLTLLRGYIEVFDEELRASLNPELSGYLTKMQASAKQLTAFINNILNISRVEADQLVLQLNKENWNDIVTNVVKDLGPQAAARGKTIQVQLATNLPLVAADRVSLYEVLSNLLDNALKYSGDKPTVTITTSVVENNTVQTTVEDRGVGIAENILPHLFEKFYRSHHTSQKVTGTGLGLYLAKVIVTAHGGNIWIRSKEGEGTTVGFTIKPYDQLAQEDKNSDNGIERTAYGWIKNHSFLRK